jgi:hypothetical protein
MSDVTAQNLVQYIARGHAFEKHVLGKDKMRAMNGVNAFRATETNGYYDDKQDKYIPPKTIRGGDLFIETPDDLIHYIENNFLKSSDTYGYVLHEQNSVCLCNSKDNVAMYFTWNNDDMDFGTVFRYPETIEKFDGDLQKYRDMEAMLGVSCITELNNRSNPNAAISAINAMLHDINENPHNYLFNKNNPESTVQNRVLSNTSRPGRDWVNDEVLHAPNNVKGHSQAYAEANELDVAPSDYVCIKQASADEFNVGRARKSLRSGRVLNSIKVFGLDSTPEPAPAVG